MLANSQGQGMIIWPIAQKLFQSVMLQQRPRWTGGRMISGGSLRHAGTRPTLPWDDGDRPPKLNFGRYDKPPIAGDTKDRNFALCALGIQRENLSVIAKPLATVQFGTTMLIPAVVHTLKPMPAVKRTISGITKDETAAVLPNATVYLMGMDRGVPYVIGSQISNGSGVYSFEVGGGFFWVVSYKSGSPDKAGATLNTLSGTVY